MKTKEGDHMRKFNTRALLCMTIVGLLLETAAPRRGLAQSPDEDIDQMFEEEFEDPGAFEPPPPPPPEDFSAPPPDFSNESPPMEMENSAGSNQPSRPSARPSAPVQVPVVQSKKGAPNAPPISEAGIEEITNENYPDLIESFDYPNAEIADVIKAISQLTGKNFIVDPGVRGKISIIAPSQITVAEAYKAFLSALAINGFTVVPSGHFLKVKSARMAQRDSIPTYSGQYYPDADVMITRIVHLKHTSAEEVNKRLRILPSKDGEMTPYEPTNSLIISDYGSNVERMMAIIKELDRPGFEEQLAVVPIRYAKAKDLADLITQIINKEPGGAGARGSFGAGVPRFRPRTSGQSSATPEELSLVAPDDRTNAIIVLGNKAGIEKIRGLVKQLDYKIDPAEAGGVFVYYVKYGEAEKIAQTLSGIAQTATTGGGTTGGAGGTGTGGSATAPRAPSPLDRQAIFDGDVRINADKNTNSLVITASRQDYQVVEDLLKKIDIPRDQVFVEAIIMEMNADKTKSWNPTYYKFDEASNGIGRAGFSSGNITSLLNPAADSGAVLGFGSSETFEINIGGQPVTVPSLVAFIQLLQKNTEANILSTPQILALDNEEAVIEVGDKIPVALSQTTGVNGVITNTPQFEQATIKLTIKPFIRPDSDVVRMEINQSVKQPSTAAVPGNLAGNAISISDRSLKTNIVVSDGDTAVLGGLMRDEESVTEAKVPLLGDIPVIGWLFKSRETRRDKINLVMFLTPKIIRNVEDSQRLLTDKANDRIDWLKRNFDGRDPYGKKMDSLPRAAKTEYEETEISEPIAAPKDVK